MALAARLLLVDARGCRFAPRIEQSLLGLHGRLRRQFPQLREEVVLTEVLEEAGRRIVRHEERRGELRSLHGFAWVVARSIALSYTRRQSQKIADLTSVGMCGDICLATVAASSSTAADIERAVLRSELLNLLSERDREVFEMKEAGFSTAEIALRQGRSRTAVDTSYCRAKARLRAELCV
jgi:RNA polymerase sigma factor (sigma-70 family)